MTIEETICTIALTRLPGFTPQTLLEFYTKVGSAARAFEYKNDIRELIPDANDKLVVAMRNSNEAVERAKVEMDFATRKQIQCICFNDDAYPVRLRECPDAPLVVYYRGNADLNRKRTISIVGTRQCTQYGKDALRNFFANLTFYCPDVLVMSGLAYGIDICAHREALSNGYDTVGVLAHGLDTLYPYAHKNTADEMISHGGLLSEYMSGTKVERAYFLARNRIVAGMSDATIVVESASHGGSLVTARIAQEYNRDVFAFPGNINSETSQGCNNLIRDNRASLITSAEDFIHAMKWDDEQVRNEKKKLGIERNLFMEYSIDEQTVIDILTKDNDQQINALAQKMGMPINKITALMFELEMKGAVKLMAGNVYHLYQ